jgi:hypothetical protein
VRDADEWRLDQRGSHLQDEAALLDHLRRLDPAREAIAISAEVALATALR